MTCAEQQKLIDTMKNTALFLAAFLYSVALYAASDKPKLIPCDSSDVATFNSYGLQIPEGWTCATGKRKLYYVWSGKNGQELLMGERKFSQERVLANEYAKDFPGYGLPQPSKNIREKMELFLAAPSVVGNSENVRKTAAFFSPMVKGVFFSKENERVVIYTALDQKPSVQYVEIYKTNDHESFFSVSVGNQSVPISMSEFFLAVVLPAIEK